MSPRNLRRRNLMDHSITSTRNRYKACSMITSEKITLSYNEKDLKNQEEDLANVFFLNDSQKKHEKTRLTRSLKKKMYLEKSKKCYSSNKSTLTQNFELKVNENVDNNSLVDIDNISYQLIEESPIQFINTPMHCTKRKKFKISPVQSPINRDKNRKEVNRRANSQNETITPKCSPISVTLTPLRTTKTPKRSPVNSTSPKIHLEVPFRLSKTPRKLQLFTNSPITSSNLDTSLKTRKNKNNNTHNTTLGNISKNNVINKSNKLRKRRTSTEKLKLMLRRSSKSPKMTSRLSNSEAEFRASKIKSDNRKDRSISVHKLRFLKKNVSKKVSPFTNKNDNDKSLSSEENQLELTLTNVDDLAEKYEEIILKKPIVLLERIPLLDSLSMSLKTQSNQRLMNTTLDVAKHVQKQLFKDLSSLNNKYPMEIEKNILQESFNNNKNVNLNNTDIISSTPISTRNSNSSFTSILLTDERIKRNSLVKTDVNNSTYDMNLTNDNQNDTMVIENEETAITDETYDLLEPRTPRLRQSRKSTTIKNVNHEKEIKKNCKVRFTTPERQMEKLQSNNNIAIRKTPRVKYISLKKSNSLSNTSMNKSVSNLDFKRSLSKSNINLTPSKNSNKKKNIRLSTSVQIKCNTENGENKDTKTNSAKKKIPNFVEIHKQMFAKMESIVDNKKRLMEQHEALKTPKVLKLDKNTMKTFRSIETRNQSYNRYGYKLRKADATNIILKKQKTNVQKKKREENKAFLKGVRTNRRFELLMKMRKISD